MNKLFLVLIFTNICFTNQLLTQKPKLTNNIWPCPLDNQDCDSELSAYDEYRILQSLSNKKDEVKLNKRNDYLFKLDSSLIWGLENNIETITNKSEYYTDIENNTNLLLRYNYDINLDKFIPNYYTFSSYNKKNQLVKYSVTNWNGSTNYNHDNAGLLRLYAYDNENRLILFETQDANDIAINRVGDRNIYHYDSLGFAKGISRYFWFDNVDTITHTNEIEYNYNENKKLESIVAKVYDQQLGWRADDSTHFTYDTFNNLSAEFHYIWNGEDIYSHSPNSESYFFYNDINQIESKTLYRLYDDENNVFKIENFFEYTYHDYGSLKEEIFFLSDFYNPRDIVTETTYSHYSDILTENTLRPRQGPLNNINLHNEKYVLFENEKYINLYYGYRELDFRTQSFYSEIDPVSTNNPVISDVSYLKVSPNPTSDFIYFDWADYSGELNITLYNITGQKVRSLESINKSAVDLTTLDSGVYFYTVGVGDQVFSGRFVKM